MIFRDKKVLPIQLTQNQEINCREQNISIDLFILYQTVNTFGDSL